MPCARQEHGMLMNCALCEALQPVLYEPCKGYPDRIKKTEPTKSKEIKTPTINRTRIEVKKEVMEYVKSKSGKISVSEISDKLGLDIELVAKILEEG